MHGEREILPPSCCDWLRQFTAQDVAFCYWTFSPHIRIPISRNVSCNCFRGRVGLRRWIKAPISQGAWVRIPPGTWGMDEHAGRPDAALLLLLLWILNYSIARFPLVRVLLLRTVHTQKSSSFYAHTATHSDTRSQGRKTRGRGHILEGGHWGGHACFAGWGTAPAPPFHWWETQQERQ